MLPHTMQAAIYPGNVLSLHMKKPPGFKYKSGMYLFVKCPDVSPFEWYHSILAAYMNQDTVHPRFLQLMMVLQASVLHHFCTWRWLPERAYPHARWLDIWTQELVREGQFRQLNCKCLFTIKHRRVEQMWTIQEWIIRKIHIHTVLRGTSYFQEGYPFETWNYSCGRLYDRRHQVSSFNYLAAQNSVSFEYRLLISSLLCLL